MSLTIACVCGRLIATTTSPHRRSTVPGVPGRWADCRGGERMSALARIGHRPIPFSHHEGT
jgi:hypothetical protein